MFSHLACSRPCGIASLDPRGTHHLCACGAPLLARYDLNALRAWPRESLADREPSLWRDYREEALMALGALSLQSLLIAGLVYQRHARRRAEMQSRTNLALAADAGQRQRRAHHLDKVAAA